MAWPGDEASNLVRLSAISSFWILFVGTERKSCTGVQLGIDFVGPLTPTAEDGSRYILTLSDYFTIWVEAVPTPNKSANGVPFKVIVYHVQPFDEE